MVAAYETRLADAKRESAGLRAALTQLEKEHRALVNEQVCLLLNDIHQDQHAKRRNVMPGYIFQ